MAIAKLLHVCSGLRSCQSGPFGPVMFITRQTRTGFLNSLSRSASVIIRKQFSDSAKMRAKKWVLVRNFQGEPKEGDLELQEEEIPELNGGEVLLEAQAWSVDPYMRPASNLVRPGRLMPGQLFARVIASKNGEYPVGTPLLASVGWRSHLVCNPATYPNPASPYPGISTPAFSRAPETGSLPSSLTLGVLGMPGATAYFGLLELCNPQPGETVLVNGAAGAVGGIVGQIAKIKGCKVIGFAGTPDKVRYIKEELGFDFAFNYKTDDLSASLKAAAPGGIDCYFDNVGGDFSATVLIRHMKPYGRVAMCGAISLYNNNPRKPVASPEIYTTIVSKQLKVEGFIVYRWYDRFPGAFADLLKWIQDGRLKYREDVTEGFENMYLAWRGMLKGDNVGKAVIRAHGRDLTANKL